MSATRAARGVITWRGGEDARSVAASRSHAADGFVWSLRRGGRDCAVGLHIWYMRESGELLTPQAWIAGGFINSLTGSITTDFLIGTTPVLVWMVVGARRLGMRHWWLYVVATFLLAFAFACPLFLLMREARHRMAPAEAVNKL